MKGKIVRHNEEGQAAAVSQESKLGASQFVTLKAPE
jgi:hypothetical protein